MICVRIVDSRGSAPRDAGTAMFVCAEAFEGTIGGGALEHMAIRTARTMLRSGQTTHREVVPLGPGLGQCCGGSVTLEFEAVMARESDPAVPVFVWGAGHVGRAIAQVLGHHPAFQLTLVDTMKDRVPQPLPAAVTLMPVTDMARLARQLDVAAHHLVLTYSHDVDLALCDALLKRPRLSLGLIGSQSKWARFRKRLEDLGHPVADVDQIICPIGNRSLGKEPQSIAIGVAAQLIQGLTST